MPWYAFDSVDDALDATRNFLFPFSWGRWLRLAVIVFFLGGGSAGLNNVTNIPSSIPSDGGTTPAPSGPTPDLVASLSELTGVSPDVVTALGFAVLGVFVLLALLSIVASSVMPFVLIDALRTNDVRVRGPFKRRFWKGIRFLLFNLGVTFLLVAPFVLAVAFLVFTNPNTAAFESFFAGFGLAGFLGVLGVFFVLFFVFGLFLSFTQQFVIPVMIATDSGVISSWRQFWPTLRGEWKQFVVYLLVRFVLQLGVGIATFIVGGILAAIIVVGAVLVGLVVVGAFGGMNAAVGSVAGVVALVVLGVLTLLALLAVSLPIKILVQSYFTAYELSVLGSANERFALLPPRPGQGDGGDDSMETGDGGNGGPSSRTADSESDTSNKSNNEFTWGDDSTPS